MKWTERFERKTLVLVAVIATLVLGAALVGASGYLSMSERHAQMSASDSFAAMQQAMESGDYAKAASYHPAGFDCPMHDAVVSGQISLQDLKTMQQWMATGDFPTEKPAGLSEAAWQLHQLHHP